MVTTEQTHHRVDTRADALIEMTIQTLKCSSKLKYMIGVVNPLVSCNPKSAADIHFMVRRGPRSSSRSITIVSTLDGVHATNVTRATINSILTNCKIKQIMYIIYK